MGIKEESRQFQERVMHMSQDELDREMVIQVNEIRRKSGLAPLKNIAEVRTLLDGPLPPEPKVHRMRKLNWWDKLLFATGIKDSDDFLI